MTFHLLFFKARTSKEKEKLSESPRFVSCSWVDILVERGDDLVMWVNGDTWAWAWPTTLLGRVIRYDVNGGVTTSEATWKRIPTLQWWWLTADIWPHLREFELPAILQCTKPSLETCQTSWQMKIHFLLSKTLYEAKNHDQTVINHR